MQISKKDNQISKQTENSLKEFFTIKKKKRFFNKFDSKELILKKLRTIGFRQSKDQQSIKKQEKNEVIEFNKISKK